jgi:gas vesicle protein
MAERDEGGGTLTFLVGFIAGAIVGGILGVLFAPQSGAESRLELRGRSGRMRERARSLGETGQEALRDAITEGRQAAGRARQEMEEWVQQTRRNPTE